MHTRQAICPVWSNITQQTQDYCIPSQSNQAGYFRQSASKFMYEEVDDAKQTISNEPADIQFAFLHAARLLTFDASWLS